MGYLAILTGEKTMSRSIANQIPLQLAAYNMGTSPSPGIRLLRDWTFHEFSIADLRQNRSVAPFCPGYTRNPRMLASVRKGDAEALRAAFSHVTGVNHETL